MQKQSRGVSRRDLLIFMFGKTFSPKVAIEDKVVDLIIGKEASLLINFRKRILK